MKSSVFPLLAAIVLLLAIASCTGDESKIKRILETDGCTQIELTGYDPMGCSDSDDYSCGFTAMKNGKSVTGVVCSGLLKGATIRYY